MTSKAQTTSITSWLAELRMECYKKNLENYETIRPLLDFKETELKKLGIHNSKDRAMMLRSLANYRVVQEDDRPAVTTITTQESHKSLLRKSSLRKLNLKSMKKGLLGSGTSKKSKKKILTSTPSLPFAIDDADQTPPPAAPSSSSTTTKHSIPEYEELPGDSPVSTQKPFQAVTGKAVENEYVPSPQNSPRFDAHRQRAFTVNDLPYEVHFRTREDFLPKQESPSGLMTYKHLSGISMESGLSFGYDVEKDFNPALPLDQQPWFYGKIPGAEAECLLNDEGDFLVRENVMSAEKFTLSLRSRGDFAHISIRTTEVVNSSKGAEDEHSTAVKYHFDGGAFDSIPELVYNHLKYQIPIDKNAFHVIVNPLCRGGTKGFSGYMIDESSTLPKNFGSKHRKHSAPSPEMMQHSTLHPMKSTSPNSSPQRSPFRQRTGLKSSTSSGDILEARDLEVIETGRNVISPPPMPFSSSGRSRASTVSTSNPGQRPRIDSFSSHRPQRVEGFEDYEVMESVSILGSSPETKWAGFSERPSHLCREDVKYAEIRYPRGQPIPAAPATSREPSRVKYAEIRFARPPVSVNASPHPFSLYDVIPATYEDTNPYQSRAELLAQKLQLEVTNSTPKPQHSDPYQTRGELHRAESSPNPFANVSNSQHHFPRQYSTPGVAKRPLSMLTTQADAAGSEMPHRNREFYVSGKSVVSSRSSPGLTQASKVPKGLPGYEALVKLHSLLGAQKTEELAYHLTRADAVCFLLAPRVGEDEGVWKNRVKNVTSSGIFVGLQTLADTDGEKLWKKLYFRHLSISQTVALCIVSAGDALDRARMLQRFIELASMLQSGNYGNLFSFMAVMQGIHVPQVMAMSEIWELLQLHYPEIASTHKELQGTISNLKEGVSMFATEQLAIPAIQHLKTVFHYEEQPLPGQPPEDYSPLGEFSSLSSGLDSIHTIISNCSQFCYNVRKRLQNLQYDATLMDFFMQDYPRTYLQLMGVCTDSPQERRRRFGVLLDALVDRLESFECL